jgi:MFS family permease
LAAALAAVFVGALDLTVIATILPRMVSDLHVNTADVDRYVWVVNGYLLAYIVAIPIVGRISDQIGRMAAFQTSLLIFVAGSIWCARADDLTGLIIGRAIQGAGGGALLPVTMALVGDLLPPTRRIGALGLVGAIDTLGWVLGPLWGAAVVGLAGGSEPWRWVFIVNVPLGVVTALAIARSLRGKQQTARAGDAKRLDLIGAGLLAGALLLLNLGLSAGAELGTSLDSGRALGGTPNPLGAYVVPLVAVSVVLAVVFVWWERRVAEPVLPLGLFAIRRFAAAIVANGVVGAALIVAMVDVPVVVAILVEPERVSAVSALMLAPFTLLMAALSFGGGLIGRRVGARATSAAGLVLVTIGYGLLWLGLRGGDYLGLLPGLAVAGAGFGLVIAPIGATAIDAAPAADRGIAAATTLVFRLLGMTIGISGLTAIAVRRLQGLVGNLDLIVQLPNETTAEFFVRQTRFLHETVIPLTLLVVRETFLIAAGLALLALIPIYFMRSDEARS